MKIKQQLLEMKEFIQKNLTLTFIVLAIITIALDHLILGPIFDFTKNFFKKHPQVIFNINESRLLTEGTGIPVNDIYLLYHTGSGEAFVRANKGVDQKGRKIFGHIFTSNFLIVRCHQCVEYSFTINNLSDINSDKLEIEFISSGEFQLLPNTVDPRITHLKERDVNGIKEYYLIIDNIPGKGTVFFIGVVKGIIGDGIRDIRCRVNGVKEYCSTNFIFSYISDATKNRRLRINDNDIDFPPIEYSNQPKNYYYDPNTSQWIHFVSE